MMIVIYEALMVTMHRECTLDRRNRGQILYSAMSLPLNVYMPKMP